MSRDLRDAGQLLQRDRGRWEKLVERRLAISFNRELLQQAERIDNFHQRLGEYRKGRKDWLVRNGMRIGHRTEAGRLLQQVRPDLPLDKVEILRSMLGKKKTVQALIAQHAAMQQRLALAEEQGRAAEQELRQVESRILHLPAPLDTDKLLQAIKPAQKVGDMDGQLARSRGEISLQKNQCLAELQRIGLWSGDLNALMELVLPLTESVQKYVQSFGEIADVGREIEKARKNYEKELSMVRAEIRKVEYSGDIPREEDLASVRSKRQEGWQLLRRQWLKRQNVEEERRQYAPHLTLVEAYEGYVGQADTIADRLRREADSVAVAAALHAKLESLVEALAENDREQEALLHRANEQAAAWKHIWQASGIAPLSPKEMSEWLVEVDKIRFKGMDLLNKEEQLRRDLQRREELKSALKQELPPLGCTPPPGEELGPLLVAAEAVLEKMNARKKELEKFTEQRDQAAKEVNKAVDDLRIAHQAQAGWQEHWRMAFMGLGMKNEVTPLEAGDLFDALQGCFDNLREADDLQKRMDGIDRDAAELDREVRELLHSVAPELKALPLEQAILQLRGLLARAQKDGALYEELNKELALLQKEIEATESIYQFAAAQMAELLSLAKCHSQEDLPLQINRFSEYQRLREKIAYHEEGIAKIGAGMAFAEIVAQAAEARIDEIPVLIEALQRDIKERLNPEINRLSQIVGEEQARLVAMDGGGRAAELSEAMERELARLRRLAERYTLVKLSARVLQQAIDRYREEHQDPVLRIAAGYFHKLTLGSFAGLRTDVDDAGQPVLVGVRPNEARLTVDQMSSGTRDQLYLALRLATLEWRLQTDEAMPFIIDDILINFDDARSRATLGILAELGKKNQVILFTHHRRIVEEARQLDPAAIEIHELVDGP